MRARRRSSKSKSSPWLKLGLALLALLVILFWAAPVALASWVRARLHDESTRHQIEQFLGGRWKARAELEPLRWSGDSVSGAQVQVKADAGWNARLSGWRLGLNWAAFRAGRWHLMNGGADSLDLQLAQGLALPSGDLSSAQGGGPSSPKPKAATASSRAETAVVDPSASGGGFQTSIPAWLRRWLPREVVIDPIGIETLTLLDAQGRGLIGSRLRTSPWTSADSTLGFKLEGGKLHSGFTLPGQPTPLELSLQEANLRISRGEIHLTSAQWRALEDASLQCRGSYSMATQRGEVVMDLSRVALGKVVTEDWRQRLSGWLEAQARWGSDQPIEVEVRLKEATLTALPLLDQLAQFTKVDRFRRLAFDQASAKYRLSGSTQVIESLVLEATGLMRLQGSLRIAADQSLQGDLMLGVTPETLQWIPGASPQVFNESPPEGAVAGLRWTKLRIAGTLKQPREDLSRRLLVAAGESVLGTGAAALNALGNLLLPEDRTGEGAKNTPEKILKGAPKLPGLDQAVDLLKGFGKGLIGP